MHEIDGVIWLAFGVLALSIGGLAVMALVLATRGNKRVWGRDEAEPEYIRAAFDRPRQVFTRSPGISEAESSDAAMRGIPKESV